jgi:outer membrane usher protein
LLSGSVAASHNGNGGGGLLSLGWERQSRSFGFGINTQAATENFSQLGLAGGEAPKRVSQLFASAGTATRGSFSVSYAAQQWRDRPDVRLASATYSVSIGRVGTLGVSLIRLHAEEKKTVLNAILTMPLGSRTTASINTVAQPGGAESTVHVQRNLPAGSGVGYRLLAGAGTTGRQEVGVMAQNSIGTYSLEAGRAQGQTAVRGSASGGIAVLGADAFLTRRMDDSFGVIEVPGYSNVRVYADNQEIGRTDQNGIALVPHMRPYQRNPIRIEESDLPLDARVDATQLDAIPFFRSAVKMTLPVKKSQGAVLQVMVGLGQLLPAGAVVRIAGNEEEFPTGLKGEVYLTGLNKMNQVTASWQGHVCSFDVAFPDSADPVPNLGTFQCDRREK